MVMELVFLGTGSAYPTPNRGASCMILRHENGACWMFDCGEGSQIQLMKSNVKPGKINKIFISHLHGDHLFGLPGLLCTISQNFGDMTESIEIYGPEGLGKYLRVCLELSQSQLGFRYTVHEIIPTRDQKTSDSQDFGKSAMFQMVNFVLSNVMGYHKTSDDKLHPNENRGRSITCDEDGSWHLFDDNQFTVRAGFLVHRIPSYGFIIQEKPRAGKLDANLIKSFGIPPGPLYSKLKNGESVLTPTGHVISPEEVLGPPRQGRKIVTCLDSCDSSKMIPFTDDADILIHEATLENSMEDKAVQNGHSTPGMAGKIAKQVKARKLILTHFSQRYQPTSLITKGEDMMAKLVTEAEIAFGKSHVIAAEDFMCIPILHQEQ